jgi:hypothetical protein
MAFSRTTAAESVDASGKMAASLFESEMTQALKV